jgi:hypothetical protein
METSFSFVIVWFNIRYEESLDINKKTLGEQNPNYAVSLGFVGICYFNLK